MMSDLIDRQQAIVIAVNAAINWHKLANPQYSIAYCIGEAMRQLPSAELSTNLAEVGTEAISRQAACEYCHEDSDGYVMPLEKNCHAFIRYGMNGWELSLKAKGWHGSAKIKYCPICGRSLTHE